MATEAISIGGMVGSAAEQFEQQSSFTVTDEARQELIRPGLDDIDHIQKEVMSGKVKVSQITDALVKQLDQAGEAAQRENRLDIVAADVIWSMKLRCWFRPWC